jgi:hypothetical protein
MEFKRTSRTEALEHRVKELNAFLESLRGIAMPGVAGHRGIAHEMACWAALRQAPT